MPSPEAPYLIRPEIFRSCPELVALQTTRKGGVSVPPYDSMNLGLHTADDTQCVIENLKRLCDSLNIAVESIVLTDQVHGTDICTIDRSGKVSGFDALITATPDIFLGIVTADCYPVLIHDPEHKASGAAHAGWQGTAGEIVLKTVQAMTEAYGTRPEACLAWVGTGISASQYEISREVAEKFDAPLLRPSSREAGKYLLDLSLANRTQLRKAGIPDAQITCSTWCSSIDRELFFSYRRDHGQTGRMLSLIGVRSAC
ncbi:MAG: peptidoglycan editing factor PgeF [Chlorobiaceae bacterium]|nr:peptidoglycan editing factor PgeF [Chlorobiaceae bacterium]